MSSKRFFGMKAQVKSIFNDLDELLEFCKDHGYVYNEVDLYKSNSYVFKEFQKFKEGRYVNNNWDRIIPPLPTFLKNK